LSPPLLSRDEGRPESRTTEVERRGVYLKNIGSRLGLYANIYKGLFEKIGS